MKFMRILAIAFLVFSLFPTLSSAVIQETASFQDLIPLVQVEKPDLLILNIDNTLIVPKDEDPSSQDEKKNGDYGSDWWCFKVLKECIGEHILSTAKPEEINEWVVQDAVPQVIAKWTEVQQGLPVKLVEENIPNVLFESLKKTRMLVVTSRDSSIADVTEKALESVDIDFRRTAILPNKTEDDHLTHEDFFYRNGILYVGENVDKDSQKADALTAFLKSNRIQVRSVVAITSRRKDLDKMEETLAAKGIRFNGLHYKRQDEKIRAYINKQFPDPTQAAKMAALYFGKGY